MQALAQIACAHAGRIKMLYEIDGAPGKFVGRFALGQRRFSGGSVAFRWELCADLAIAFGKLFFAGSEVAVIIEVANDQLGGGVQFRRKAQCAQLPRQVIGERRRRGEKILKRGLFAVVVLRLCAKTGIEIFLEVRSEIDFVERVLGRRRGLFRSLFKKSEPLLALIAFLHGLPLHPASEPTRQSLPGRDFPPSRHRSSP